MADPGRAEIVKWRWLILLVTVPGIALFALPLIPGKYKIMLALPLYAMFVFVFYKYLCVKREALAATGRNCKQTPQTLQGPPSPPGAVRAGAGNRGAGSPVKKTRKKR